MGLLRFQIMMPKVSMREESAKITGIYGRTVTPISFAGGLSASSARPNPGFIRIQA